MEEDRIGEIVIAGKLKRLGEIDLCLQRSVCDRTEKGNRRGRKEGTVMAVHGRF
jgi:hypothetical protein